MPRAAVMLAGAVRRLLAVIFAALLFTLGVAAALAEPSPTTTADTTTDTAPTTTTPTTTAPPTTATVTTTAPTTTTTPTTQPAPTTTSPPTTAPGAPASPAYALPAAQQCPLAGVVLLPPNGAASVVGAITDGRVRVAQIGNLAYPSGGSIITASSVALRDGACASGRLTGGEAHLRNVSLFGGAVTAAHIVLELGRTTSASVERLVVDGKGVAPAGGARIPLASWGYLVAGSRQPIPVSAGDEAIAALAVHLVQPHGGLPAGTLLLLASVVQPRPSATAKAQAQRRAQARHRKKRSRATRQPLTVTPPLGQRHYIFPVVGPADYGDSYGAFRGDVPGNWHHGDDIFAPLGAPVVAVAGGTINRVGWEKLGGWRLWVRDSVGDEFYYAHLSGYAPTDLRSNRVSAGEVIGFIGNTGDAFTTSPHLHFEVHPRPLLHLGYDGAVDPTTYLNSWTRVDHVHIPFPVHPPLPTQPLIRKEAGYVFRELLAARHLIKHAPSLRQRPRVEVPADANGRTIAAPAPTRRAAPKLPRRSGGSSRTITLIACVAFLALFALWMFQAPLRRRLARGAPARGEVEEAPTSEPPPVAASWAQIIAAARSIRRLRRERDPSV